ncbi:MAG: sigma-54 dependent transcriptional regulator [Candidatus Eiseniibacteriota bacterium]|jgi:DNA-binding NtrC family response regulator
MPDAARRLLLVDDDRGSREATAGFLEDAGYSVVTARDGKHAISRITEGFAAVITDLAMPQVDGLELLAAARRLAPHTPVIMLTGHGNEEIAVRSLKAGAFHYLTKPVKPDELLSLIGQACEKHRMAVEIAELRERLRTGVPFHGLIGRSEAMRHVLEQIETVADTRSTVLVEGESGTGKELVARAIHLRSNRRSAPFIAINCAALPAALIESELFGHEKGAFTGATDPRVGKFAAADGGTLLIDEIGEMQLDLQSKMLRAIESRRITPLGSNRETPVDVRIIASTHRDLAAEVQAGRFREDLYYRLHVVRIVVPPLRQRPDDVPLLVRTFIDQLGPESNRPARDITTPALRQLERYHWPGNVRELRNTIESMIVMSSREVLDVDDLPESLRATEPGERPTVDGVVQPGMTMEEVEREAIRRTLESAGGNRTEASRRLGIGLRTLQRKIRKYGLD